MTKTLVIIGAGGHGKVVADCAEALMRYDAILFADTGYPEKTGLEHWDVVAHPDVLNEVDGPGTEYFVAIGNNEVRARECLRLLSEDKSLATLIHPRATVSRYSELGEGSLVCAGAVVNPFSKLGLGSIVNTGASVDHDCILSDWTHVAPGSRLAGTVSLGNKVFVGAGAVVIPGISIGENTTVGAGAAVISNLPPNVTAVGVPAKVLS